MTSEAMISASPDVILVMSDGLESVGGIEQMLQMPGIAQTPAAAGRRIIDMADTELLTFGARSGQTVRALAEALDRKSTRLNSSHVAISYAVFCLQKKNSTDR